MKSKLCGPVQALDQFTAEFLSEFRRLLVAKSRFKAWQIDEICQQESLVFLVNRTSIEVAYTSGAHYARARAAHAGEDFKRRERKQSGQGVRLKAQSDGTLQPGRHKISLDAPLGESDLTVLDRVGNTEFQSDVVNRLDAEAFMTKAFLSVSADTRQMLWDSAAMGMTVTEAAQLQGVRRETGSRKVNAATQSIRAMRAAGEL